MKTKILLIGSEGYIGSRLYDYLIYKNYNITCVDIGWFGIVNENPIICDYNKLTREFIDQFTHIICLASHSSVSMCVENYESCHKNNVTNFLNLLEKINPTQKFIYASSLAIYGNNNIIVTENDIPNNPINIYDYSLMVREYLTKFYKKNTIGLRFGTVGGFSKNFRKENLINSLSYDSIMYGKITISNPESYRSVLGLGDLCRAIVQLIESDMCGNYVFNLSSINNKIIEFGKKIQSITNCELIVNNSLYTQYSFRSSSDLFSKKFNFQFENTTESMYEEIKNNILNIKQNVNRTTVNYK